MTIILITRHTLDKDVIKKYRDRKFVRNTHVYNSSTFYRPSLCHEAAHMMGYLVSRSISTALGKTSPQER